MSDTTTTNSIPCREDPQTIRVLFAEDDGDTVSIFREVIHNLGWQGIYVENAVEMMDAVNNLMREGLGLDAVVAQIAFLKGPKLTGITAAREIRKVMPNVPIIFISSYVTSIIREEVRRVNAELFSKPVDAKTLFVRLSRLIYWNRLARASEYEGPERRVRSINHSCSYRRATDYTLATPPRIAQTLDELREKS